MAGAGALAQGPAREPGGGGFGAPSLRAFAPSAGLTSAGMLRQPGARLNYGGPPGAFVADPGWRGQQEQARSGVRSGQFAPLGSVIAGIRQRIPGRQLDTGLEYQAGRAVYRVRWMTSQGRRMDIVVDAASGAILSER